MPGIHRIFSWKFAFCAGAEIEHLIATLFQPDELGRRSEISARVETPQAESGPNSCFILQTPPDILARQFQTICQRCRMSYLILLVL